MSIHAAEHHQLTVELARQALHRANPDELAAFDDLAAEYFADPRGALQPAHRDETLGFGLDLTLLTPYLLAVAGFVLPMLNDILTDVAKQQGATLVGSWVAGLVRREPATVSVRLTVEQARHVQTVAYHQARRVGLDDGRARLVADSIVGAVTLG